MLSLYKGTLAEVSCRPHFTGVLVDASEIIQLFWSAFNCPSQAIFCVTYDTCGDNMTQKSVTMDPNCTMDTRITFKRNKSLSGELLLSLKAENATYGAEKLRINNNITTGMCWI